MSIKEIEYILDKMVADDWEQIRSIYLEGISAGHATFEADAPSWEEWDSSHMHECRLVARTGNDVLAWAALSPASNRCAYSGVAEVSVYVGSKYQGQGIGGELLTSLIDESEKIGIWTVQVGIFPENINSINLHKRYGFREVGRREKLGKMSHGSLEGIWRDIVLMERRSKSVGID